EIHGERRGAKAGRKVIPGVLDSRLRPEPDMDLATKEQSSSSAISELQRHLQDGSFVVTAELSPPVSTDPAEFIDHALALRGLVTAINVTDGAGSKAHMSSLAAAHFLVRSGVEPVLQITCRDRNRIALQAELLGAAALGIRNILALRGDDPTLGDQPDTKAVFDLDTTALLATAQQMRSEHRLPSGTEIKGAVRFVLGAAELPVETPGVAGAHVMAPTFHSAIGPVIEASRVAGRKRAGARRC